MGRIRARPRMRWRPEDRLQLIRLIFVAFCVASLLVLVVVSVVVSGERRTVALAGAALMPPLVWKWIAEFRRRPTSLAFDVAEWGALVATAVGVGNALAILILLYARISTRALDVGTGRVAVLAGGYAAAFLAAIAVTSPDWGLTPANALYALLVSGFALAPPVMHLLADTMTRLKASMAAERRAQQALLAASEENFQQVFERNPQALWLHDADSGQVLAANAAAMKQYGFTREEFLALRAEDLIVEGGPVGGGQHRTKDGGIIEVQTDTGSVVFQHRRSTMVLARDVGEQRRLQQRLEHNALHDPLTGLANQVLLRRSVRASLDRARIDPRNTPAVLVLDLEGFKFVNDSLGHAAGDQVIAIAAARIARCIKGRDMAARLGGDEFSVLLDMTDDGGHAPDVARRIIDEIQQPIHLSGRKLTISACCGVATYDESRTPEQMLSDADIAVYAAKSQGPGSVALFHTELRTALMDRIQLEQDLTTAIANDQLLVAYQPQVDLETGRAVAVEALVRWAHPERGAIPPDTFITLAEQMGIIPSIDEWVLRTALSTLRMWSATPGLEGLRVSVNLSGHDLGREDLVDVVRCALTDSGVEPWRLELELTETAAVAQPVTAILRLRELRALGVRLAIDDFGTGFSMLSTLRDLPVDRLKIDRSFVMGIDGDDDARAIVQSTIAMGHSLGLDLCAEGVETDGGAAVLRELGCDTAQGYLFSRPLSDSATLDWLRGRAAAPPQLTVMPSPAPERIARVR